MKSFRIVLPVALLALALGLVLGSAQTASARCLPGSSLSIVSVQAYGLKFESTRQTYFTVVKKQNVGYAALASAPVSLRPHTWYILPGDPPVPGAAQLAAIGISPISGNTLGDGRFFLPAGYVVTESVKVVYNTGLTRIMPIIYRMTIQDPVSLLTIYGPAEKNYSGMLSLFSGSTVISIE